MKRTALALAATALLTLAGCAKDSPTPAATGSSSTVPSSSKGSTPASTPAGTPAGTSGSTPGSAPGTTQPAGCSTSLALVNAAAAEEPSLTDHKLDVKTAWSDQGPHPDNTVDYDATLDVAIAEFPIEKDPQFGYSIPIGDPKAPTGKIYESFRLTANDGKIAQGQTFITSTSSEKADGTIMSFVLYAGSTRLLPGDATVTITDVTNDQVCGTIKATTKTDLQTFVGVEGTFKLTRIQALEAKDT